MIFDLFFLELLNIRNSFLFRAQELTFKLMTDFFNKRTFLLHLEASGYRHKILLSVNKLCMTHLYPQGNFVSLQCFHLSFKYDIYKDTIFKISIKSSHINFSIIFVQFILFKKINVNINTGVIVIFLKHVIIHSCALFHQTGDTVDEPVQ